MKALAPLLLFLLALPCAAPRAGTTQAAFAVGARVVARSDPARLQAVPLPQPGHLMRDTPGGRDYFYAGEAEAAQSWYHERMPAAGYVLEAERAAGPLREMRWVRDGEIVLLRLETGVAPAATRIGVAAVAVRK